MANCGLKGSLLLSWDAVATVDVLTANNGDLLILGREQLRLRDLI